MEIMPGFTLTDIATSGARIRLRHGGKGPPLLLLHGDQDPQMPINQSHEFEGAYDAQGLDATFVVVHGAVHGGEQFFDAKRTQIVAEFLDAHLRRELTSDSAQR